MTQKSRAEMNWEIVGAVDRHVRGYRKKKWICDQCGVIAAPDKTGRCPYCGCELDEV